jgi:hypothetical protein
MSSKRNSKSRYGDETSSLRIRDKIRRQWSVRLLRRGSLIGPAFIEFKFPTQGGGFCELTMRNSDLRHTNTLLDQFSDYLPIFPADIGVTKRTMRVHPTSCLVECELDCAVTGCDRVHRYTYVRNT